MQYLLGLCVGSFLLSIVIALMLLFPELLRPSNPKFVLSRTRSALGNMWQLGEKAVDSVTTKVAGAGKAVVATAKGPAAGGGARRSSTRGSLASASSSVAPGAGSAELAAGGSGLEVGDGAAAAAAPAPAAAACAEAEAPGKDLGEAAPAKAVAAAAAAEPGNGEVPGSREGDVELVAGADGAAVNPVGHYTRYLVWTLLAGGLYIAAVVLLALGANTLFNHSLASFFVSSRWEGEFV